MTPWSGTTHIMIQGCLSGNTGNYTLRDKSGTIYRLNAKDKGLRHKVGHTVQISGIVSPDNNSEREPARGAGKPVRLTVATINDVSRSCKDSMMEER